MEDRRLKKLIIQKFESDLNSSWIKLSDEQKDGLVNEVLEFFKAKLARTEKTLGNIRTKKENYKLLFLGIGIGVLGNLIANIIDRNFDHGFFYNAVVLSLSLLISFLVLRSLNEQISKELQNDELLGGLLIAMEKDPDLINSLKQKAGIPSSKT